MRLRGARDGRWKSKVGGRPAGGRKGHGGVVDSDEVEVKARQGGGDPNRGREGPSGCGRACAERLIRVTISAQMKKRTLFDPDVTKNLITLVGLYKVSLLTLLKCLAFSQMPL